MKTEKQNQICANCKRPLRGENMCECSCPDTSNNSLRDSGDNGSTSDLQSEDSGSTPESIHNSTLEQVEELEKQFNSYYKSDWSRGGRQERIHKRVSGSFENKDIKIMCGTNVNKIHCVNDDWEIVECILCIRKGAKLLKAEIEKGCGLKIFVENNHSRYCGESFWGKKRFCSKCQNLIERLNKIIRENKMEKK